jgi:cytidylate kinase
MYALTIGGQAGAGGQEIGWMVSRALGARYIEGLALRRLARILGATAEAVARKELAFCSRKDRFVQKLEVLFSQFGWYGADLSMGMAPYAEYFDDGQDSVKRLPAQISDAEYVDGIYQTADQFIAEDEDLVKVNRAGCLTMRRHPDVFHIGLFAPLDIRVARVAKQLKLGTNEAEEVVTGLERARSAWFAKIADADPMDRLLYHEVFHIDSGVDDVDVAGAVTQQVTRDLPASLSDGYETLDALLNPVN